MKTAMQELIDRLKRNIKEMPNEINTYTQGYKAGLNFVIECATTSLEKEKEQIKAAVCYGQNNHEASVYEEGELYYNEIYNSDASIIKSSIPNGNIEVTNQNK
jgi:hypothetical protein